jgi:hypothetical protein
MWPGLLKLPLMIWVRINPSNCPNNDAPTKRVAAADNESRRFARLSHRFMLYQLYIKEKLILS